MWLTVRQNFATTQSPQHTDLTAVIQRCSHKWFEPNWLECACVCQALYHTGPENTKASTTENKMILQNDFSPDLVLNDLLGPMAMQHDMLQPWSPRLPRIVLAPKRRATRTIKTAIPRDSLTRLVASIRFRLLLGGMWP